MAPKYQLRCLETGTLLDDHYTNNYNEDGLLRAEYSVSDIQPNPLPGLWRWLDWLPVSKPNQLIAGSICYRSEGLADALCLENLWISFNGYWPERGANCPTTTFKDMEAVTTLQRLEDYQIPGMICASAGNTARAFAHFGGLANYPVLIIVAEKHLKRLWVPKSHPTDSIIIIGIQMGGYNDAIDVTSRIAENNGWRREGGVQNIARRDGIGSILLTAVEEMRCMPKHYFQGVGGGPGPIGVYEMGLRLVGSAKFAGCNPPRLHLSQNDTFSPVHDAWQLRQAKMKAMPDIDHSEVFSDYLVNNNPAYSVRGGLYDCLKGSDGQTYAISEKEAREAEDLFIETEGIDPLSPASVAIASLIQACRRGEVSPDDAVLLNISGGGRKRYNADVEKKILKPIAVLSKDDAVSTGRQITK